MGNIIPKSLESWGSCSKIISRKQLIAVIHCITFIKQNSSFYGLFIINGLRERVGKISRKINQGDTNILNYLIAFATPRECASGLFQFLRQLNRPLLPMRVQQLISADNPGINRTTIALDALGLLYEETRGLHFELLFNLFDMMKILTTIGSLRPTELRVSYGPFLLIPLFFKKEQSILHNWKNIACILNEMILFSHLLSIDNIDLTELNYQRNLSRQGENVASARVVTDSSYPRRTLRNRTYVPYYELT